MSRFNWGWGITIAYVVFALATLGFVFFAFTQDVDLVREDYYQHSLEHDVRVEARKNAKALPDAVLEQGSQTVHIHLPVAHREATGSVELYRASSTTSDVRNPLVLDDQSTMSLSLAGLAAGKWRLTVSWRIHGIPYELEKVLEVEE